jgi:potassium-dependent mechanosensitive channel
VTQADAELETPQARAAVWKKAIQTGLKETRTELRSGIRGQLALALGILTLALVLQFALVRLWQMIRHSLEMLMGPPAQAGEGETVPEHPAKLLNFALKIGLLLILSALWTAASLWAANLFPQTRALSNQLSDNILGTLTQPLIPIGAGFSIVSFVMLAGLLTSLVIGAGVLTDLLRSRFLGVLGISTGIQEAIAVVFKYGFITLGVIILLQIWGIDLSSLAILASALGVGIGFGFQDIAKNLGSGLVLVFERPIQVGDFVEVGGYTGTIETLGARSIRIRTLDDLTVFVPNSRFLEEEVTNWSHQRTPSRIKIPVSVIHGSDLEAVKEALIEVTEDQKAILKSPKPQVLFSGFGASSLDFVLLVWISRPQLQMRIKSDLNFKIDAVFRRRHIEIPLAAAPARPPEAQPPSREPRT